LPYPTAAINPSSLSLAIIAILINSSIIPQNKHPVPGMAIDRISPRMYFQGINSLISASLSITYEEGDKMSTFGNSRGISSGISPNN